jgi:hypothetical protein
VKIVAIDLGTSTGIAHNLNGVMEAKTIKLATAKEVTLWGKNRLTRREDPRVARLADELNKYREADVCVFEDCQFSSYTKATQLWASLRAAVWLTFGCFGFSKIVECVPVTTLKMFATGAGNATKEMMAAALKKQYPLLWRPCYCSEDDTVDAIWLYLWAEKTLSRAAI